MGKEERVESNREEGNMLQVGSFPEESCHKMEMQINQIIAKQLSLLRPFFLPIDQAHRQHSEKQHLDVKLPSKPFEVIQKCLAVDLRILCHSAEDELRVAESFELLVPRP